MHSATAHHQVTDAQPDPEQRSQRPASSPGFVHWAWGPAVRRSLRPAWVSHPGYAPCQLLVHPLPGRAGEGGKTLT